MTHNYLYLAVDGPILRDLESQELVVARELAKGVGGVLPPVDGVLHAATPGVEAPRGARRAVRARDAAAGQVADLAAVGPELVEEPLLDAPQPRGLGLDPRLRGEVGRLLQRRTATRRRTLLTMPW